LENCSLHALRDVVLVGYLIDREVPQDVLGRVLGCKGESVWEQSVLAVVLVTCVQHDFDVGQLSLVGPPVSVLVASMGSERDAAYCSMLTCRLGDSKRTGGGDWAVEGLND
jgi:hypothetical protein